jgi:hypothetical protein
MLPIVVQAIFLPFLLSCLCHQSEAFAVLVLGLYCWRQTPQPRFFFLRECLSASAVFFGTFTQALDALGLCT